MLKRFVYEWKRSVPFFLTFFMAATLYYFIVRLMIQHKLYLTMRIILPFILGIGLGMAAVVYVILNVKRELTNADGILTFLTPLAPWKMMVAKWLNFIVSYGLTFIALRFLIAFFPLEGSGMDTFSQNIASLTEHAATFNVPFLFLMGRPAIGVLLFVLRWTLVLVLLFWVLGWTERLFAYGRLKFGKFAVRLAGILLCLLITAILVTHLSAWFPYYWEANTLQIIHREAPSTFYGLIGSMSYFYGPEGPAGPTLSGIPIVAFLALTAEIAFFLWRANVNWKRMDR